MVFDVYRALSIKRETCESPPGSGDRVSSRSETPKIKSARGANAFLQNDKNKVELFTMFAEILIELHTGRGRCMHLFACQ